MGIVRGCFFFGLILGTLGLVWPVVVQAAGLDDAFKISSSGMLAQKFRLKLINENIANIATLQTETGLPYQKKYAVLESTPSGVRVSRVETSKEPLPRYFDDANPLSDADGFFYFSNVNLPDEMVDMSFTEILYEANVNAYKSAKAMYQQSLELLK